MTEVVVASNPHHYEQIVQLLNAFHQWCCSRYAGERSWEFNDYFDETAWEKELSSIAQIYFQPEGVFLLATNSSQAIGCVALKKYSNSICEIKRLYVRDECRGQGVAKTLMREILNKARKLDYQYARLEFGELFTESKALYKSIGFKSIDAYSDIPERLKPKMEFMEFKL